MSVSDNENGSLKILASKADQKLPLLCHVSIAPGVTTSQMISGSSGLTLTKTYTLTKRLAAYRSHYSTIFAANLIATSQKETADGSALGELSSLWIQVFPGAYDKSDEDRHRT